MKKRLVLLFLFPLLLTSCDNEKQEKTLLRGLTKLDNFCIPLPTLKENTKSYISDGKNNFLDYFRPFDYSIKDGYQIISNILEISTFYNRVPCDGWNYSNILYYFSDNTYERIFIMKGKYNSEYFQDSYLICIDGSNLKPTDCAYFCEYKDEKLYNELINYYDCSLKVAGEEEYVKIPYNR